MRCLAAAALLFHHECTCSRILFLTSIPPSPVGGVAMSYCCRNARSHIPDARTRSLYSYEGAPRPCGASTRHKLEKTALATLVMRSFVKVCSVLALSPRFPGVAFDNHCFIWAERIAVTNESRAGAGAGARAVAVVGAGAGAARELMGSGAGAGRASVGMARARAVARLRSPRRRRI